MTGSRKIAYINARLIDPASGTDAPGALLCDGARIADLGPALFNDGVPADIARIDCGGRILCPRLIDSFVHVGVPGEDHKEDLASAGAAAAASGITTLIAQPAATPGLDSVALVEYFVRRAGDASAVAILPVGAATAGLAGQTMCEVGLMKRAGAVAFGDGRRGIADSRLLYRLLQYLGPIGAPLIDMPGDARLADGGVIYEGETATRLGLPAIPPVAEVIGLERDIRLAEASGGPIHFPQLSTAASIDALRAARGRQAPVTAGLAVHHLVLNETAIEDYRSFARCDPPLPSEADRTALVAALADGTVDCLTSGHDPQDQESKRLPFARAAGGISGLDTLLPLALELHLNEGVPLIRLLHALSAGPAAVFGLECGRLAPGAPADLAVIDIDPPWRIDCRRFHSRSANSPFDGRPVQGRAWRTVAGGRTVFESPPGKD